MARGSRQFGTVAAAFAAALLTLAVPICVTAHDPGAAPHKASGPGGAKQPAGLSSGSHTKSPGSRQAAALETSRAAVGRRIGDHRLLDRKGRTLRLSQFRGRPLIVNMIYTSCANTCPALTTHVANVVEIARDALGDDSFAVITVGFDTRNDKPARMRAYARARGLTGPNWKFLSTDEATIRRLSADLGFVYFRSPNGFDHLAQTTIVDSDGRVFRQVYGSAFPAPRIVEPLKALILKTKRRSGLTDVSAVLGRIRLFCTIYDPRTGRYHIDYSLILAGIIGLVCLSAVAGFVIREWRRGRTGGKAA